MKHYTTDYTTTLKVAERLKVSISCSSKVKSKARTGGRDGSCGNCWLMFMVTVHPLTCMLNIDWCGKQMGYGTIFLTFMTVGVVGVGAIYEVVCAQANTTRWELSLNTLKRTSSVVFSEVVATDRFSFAKFASVDRPIYHSKARFCSAMAPFSNSDVTTYKSSPAYILVIPQRFGVYGLYTHAPLGLARI